MYVAVKGGAKAISASHAVLAEARRGDPAVPEISTDQIAGQLALAVDRVMAEGALYDRGLAALAVKQAQGDLQEAAFLFRAYRTTLPRFGMLRTAGDSGDDRAATSDLARPTKICRAGRFWGLPSTTRTVCSISRSPTTTARPRPQRHGGEVDAGRADAARH